MIDNNTSCRNVWAIQEIVVAVPLFNASGKLIKAIIVKAIAHHIVPTILVIKIATLSSAFNLSLCSLFAFLIIIYIILHFLIGCIVSEFYGTIDRFLQKIDPVIRIFYFAMICPN